MMLKVNDLFAWPETDAQERILRILWVSQHGDAYLNIDIHDPKAFPEPGKTAALQTAMDENIARKLDHDPYAHLLKAEDTLSEKERAYRDKGWNWIVKIVGLPAHGGYHRKSRGNAVQAACVLYGIKKSTIYRCLRRYWQRGLVKNALIPDWKEGMPHEGPDTVNGKPVHKKRGRPSKAEKRAGTRFGVPITERIKEYFTWGCGLYPTHPIKDIYERTLQNYFHKGFVEGVPILPPPSELPTLRQFRYWYQAYWDTDRERKAINRYGSKWVKLNLRAITGFSQAFGPGSVYQIDATIGNIYLVSSLRRTRLVGRPVVFLVVDVFSRLIVGIHITLENPSYLGAAMALFNAFEHKQELCRRYGIDCHPDEWPALGLPQVVYADGGELRGNQANNLANLLGVQVTNEPPYRADLKGIVERSFKSVTDLTIRWLPGAVDKERTRGDRDTRHDAVLNMHDFWKIMLRTVLFHNRTALANYRLETDMIEEGIDPIPSELWRWGIQNRSGQLRTKDTDVLRQSLLPVGQGSITPRGILFKKLHYTCPRAIQGHWFAKARMDGRKPLRISFDPRYPGRIYIPAEAPGRFDICEVTEIDRQFIQNNWEEVDDHFENRAERQEDLDGQRRQNLAALRVNNEAVIANAKAERREEQKMTGVKLTKTAAVASIHKNRQEELQAERNTNTWKPPIPGYPPAPGKIVSILPDRPTKTSTGHPEEDLSLIQRLLEEEG